MAEKIKVGREAKARDTWVPRLSGPSAVEIRESGLRGTDKAIGSPAIT